MPSKGQIVHHSEESEPSEPPRIEDFNWNNKCHVISAIACLVEAVYILSHEESSLALRWRISSKHPTVCYSLSWHNTQRKDSERGPQARQAVLGEQTSQEFPLSKSKELH
nr:hypothetical protein CFP56_74234 [Quercus suber]